MEQTKEVESLKHRLAARFSQARTVLNLDYAQLQTESSIAHNIIFRLEKECTASLDAFFALALYYRTHGINPDWLLNVGEDDPVGKPMRLTGAE